MAVCPASSAPTICSSVTSCAPASTIITASALPAMIRSSVLALRCANVGLMTYAPSTKPTRTPAIVFWNGISDSASAQPAPVTASTSES